MSSRYIAVKLFVVAWQQETEEGRDTVRSVAHWHKIIFAVCSGYVSSGPVEITKILDYLSNYWLLKKMTLIF
jgi:hypothetical protein